MITSDKSRSKSSLNSFWASLIAPRINKLEKYAKLIFMVQNCHKLHNQELNEEWQSFVIKSLDARIEPKIEPS